MLYTTTIIVLTIFAFCRTFILQLLIELVRGNVADYHYNWLMITQIFGRKIKIVNRLRVELPSMGFSGEKFDHSAINYSNDALRSRFSK